MVMTKTEVIRVCVSPKDKKTLDAWRAKANRCNRKSATCSKIAFCSVAQWGFYNPHVQEMTKRSKSGKREEFGSVNTPFFYILWNHSPPCAGKKHGHGLG